MAFILIPLFFLLIISSLTISFYAIVKILSNDFKESKVMWILISMIGIIGPIIWLTTGRKLIIKKRPLQSNSKKENTPVLEYYKKLIGSTSDKLKTTAILGFVLLLYGYASKFIGIYFFWESKSLGWLVVLVLSIIILSKDVKTRKLKKSPTVGGYIGIGLISFILLIKAILIISIPISDAYSNAKTQLKEMESIVVQTGEIQGFSYRTNGAFSYSSNGTDEYGSLDMTIIIKGEAKYIEKDILIEKTPKFNWQITYMEN